MGGDFLRSYKPVLRMRIKSGRVVWLLVSNLRVVFLVGYLLLRVEFLVGFLVGVSCGVSGFLVAGLRS